MFSLGSSHIFIHSVILLSCQEWTLICLAFLHVFTLENNCGVSYESQFRIEKFCKIKFKLINLIAVPKHKSVLIFLEARCFCRSLTLSLSNSSLEILLDKTILLYEAKRMILFNLWSGLLDKMLHRIQTCEVEFVVPLKCFVTQFLQNLSLHLLQTNCVSNFWIYVSLNSKF